MIYSWQLRMELDEVIDRVNGLRPLHYSCDGDNFYSCPKSENGCADSTAGTECTCDFKEGQAKVDGLITLIESIKSRYDIPATTYKTRKSR